MQFIRNILLEDITAVRNRYPNISDVDFTTILNLDPTYKDGSNSVGKYTKWLLNLFNKGKLELRLHVKDLLQQFEAKRNSLQNKDIGQFKSIEELEDILAKTAMPELSKRQQLRQTQKAVHNADLDKDAELVYEDSHWEVWVPKTYEASCRLGRNTRWCTATTENDYYYKQYSEDGPLYININKSNSEDKYQFHFETSQFMDKDDSSIPLVKFLSDHPDLFAFYKPKIFNMLKINIDNDGKTIVQIPFRILAEKFSNRDLSDDFIEACLYGDIFEHWYESDYVSLSNYSLDELEMDEENLKRFDDFGLIPSDIDKIINGEEIEGFDLESTEELKFALSQAVRDAENIGSQTECLNDFTSALQKSIPNYVSYNLDMDNGLLILQMKEDTVLQILSDHGADDYLSDLDFEDIIVEAMSNKFRFFEPLYGWQGYDKEVFNDTLNRLLSDISVERS